MMCRDHERGYVGLLTQRCGGRPILFDPIKPKGSGVAWLNNSLVTSLPTPSILAMSLVNNRVFERSMGHQISRVDARFHLHTSDGQHYPSNQQVKSCTDLD